MQAKTIDILEEEKAKLTKHIEAANFEVVGKESENKHLEEEMEKCNNLLKEKDKEIASLKNVINNIKALSKAYIPVKVTQFFNIVRVI